MIGFVFKVYLLHIQNDRKRKETFKEVYLRYDLLWRRFECRAILRAIQYDTDKVTRAQTYCYIHIYTRAIFSSSHPLADKREKRENKRGRRGRTAYTNMLVRGWSLGHVPISGKIKKDRKSRVIREKRR